MNPTISRPTVRLTANEPGASVSKFLVALYLGGGTRTGGAAVAAQYCRSTPAVEKVFTSPAIKTAIGAGTTAQTGWASELSNYGISQEAYLLLQSASILGRLAPGFRHLPFRVKAPKESGGGAGGAWRGEGYPRPVVKTTTDTLQQEYREAGVIIAVTKELFRFGAIAEAALRATVIAAVSRYIDAQLLDPSVAATAAHPASLTYGAQPVTSTGSTAAQIIADLASLLAAIESPGDELRWVMRPLTYYTIAAKLAGAGMPVTPGFLLTIPVVLGSTSPHQITLIDASNVAFSSEDTLALDVSTETSIQMDDAPTQSGAAGTGSTMVSAYQSELAFVRADLAVTWQSIHYGTSSPTVPAGASYMPVTY
jgi:hypothetical protein